MNSTQLLDHVRSLALAAMMVLVAGSPATGQPPAPTVPPGPAKPAVGTHQEHTFISEDGVEVKYSVFIPPGFKKGDIAPVLIVLPPGNQVGRMMDAAVDYFRPGCEEQGWVVLSPEAPTVSGKSATFLEQGARHIPNLLRDVRSWVRPEGNRFHLAGASRGGTSVFHVAPRTPKEWLSITVFPGFPVEGDVPELGKLAGIPIRVFVGQDDSVPWHDGARLLEAQAKKLKLDLQVTRVPGESHVIGSLAGGKMLEIITPFRAKTSTMDAQRSDINLALDAFHDAASKAEEARYFSFFAPEGVFIGTDVTERWTVEQFRAYARPLFMKGKGWTYKPRARNIELSPDKTVAWFDEILDNEKYGTCRGTGVLRLDNGKWLISQYHLTVPVPNELLERVATMIRNQPKGKPK